jgi:hypothetical protein
MQPMEASSREVNGLLFSYIEIEVQINVEAKKLHCIREERIEKRVTVVPLTAEQSRMKLVMLYA